MRHENFRSGSASSDAAKIKFLRQAYGACSGQRREYQLGSQKDCLAVMQEMKELSPFDSRSISINL